MNSTRWYRIGAGLLILGVAGCTRMAVVNRPADYMVAKAPTQVWVTSSDNAVIDLMHPRLREDTLSGFASGKYYEIPLADVKQMRARSTDMTRTLLLAGVGAAAIGVIVVTQSSTSSGCSGAPSAQQDPEENPFIC